MNKESIHFLEQLMRAPSPSGYEDQVRQTWYNEMKVQSDQIKIDVHGNVIATINQNNAPRIMLAGHMDELGFQVKYVSEEGFIYFNTMGGFELGIIPGRKVRIHTKNGDVLGVTGKKAIHLKDKEDAEKATKLHELYIDIGAKDQQDAKSVVEIGDPITYDPNFEALRNNLYASRGFDDKIGAFVVGEVLRNVFNRKGDLKSGLFGVATVQEEIGLRGARTSAYGIDPHIGIAIDVTHATDTPDTEAQKDGEIKMGTGAVITRGPNINPKIFDLLKQIAVAHKIPYQVEAISHGTGTDANAIQLTRSGVAVGLISIPCRYMHTYTEVISLQDVESAINLLTEFCLMIDEKVDLIP